MHPGLLLIVIGAIVATAAGIMIWIGQSQWSSTSVVIVPAGATILVNSLHDEAMKTSEEILSFVIGRQRNEPQQSDYYNRDTFTQESWDAWTTALIKYHQDTKNIYNQKFGGRVKFLQEQFQKWGLSNKELDMLCLDATNYFAMRDGASGLDMLARQLIRK